MKLLITAWFVLCSVALFAQNTEQPDPLRPSIADSTRKITDSTRAANAGVAPRRTLIDTVVYRVRLTADGTLTSGNVSRSLLQLVGSFDIALSKLAKLSTAPSFVYGRQAGVLAEREYFGDARVTFLHERRLYYLAFGSYEKSNLRQISNRYTLAGGIGYKLVARKRVYISVTNVLIREYTDYAILNDVNTFRNSARIFGEYTFGDDRWRLSHTVFYQPALQASPEGLPRNVRWNGSVSMQYKFSTNLSFRTTLANSYESIVVPGRVNNDLRLTVGMTYDRK